MLSVAIKKLHTSVGAFKKLSSNGLALSSTAMDTSEENGNFREAPEG